MQGVAKAGLTNSIGGDTAGWDLVVVGGGSAGLPDLTFARLRGQSMIPLKIRG